MRLARRLTPFLVLLHLPESLFCTSGSKAETSQAPYPHTPLFLFFLRRLDSVSTEILFDYNPL